MRSHRVCPSHALMISLHVMFSAAKAVALSSTLPDSHRASILLECPVAVYVCYCHTVSVTCTAADGSPPTLTDLSEEEETECHAVGGVEIWVC